ncbi:MAG: hypothetical protein ACR2OU_12560 [Thermomicrobiales bacterium]
MLLLLLAPVDWRVAQIPALASCSVISEHPGAIRSPQPQPECASTLREPGSRQVAQEPLDLQGTIPPLEARLHGSTIGGAVSWTVGSELLLVARSPALANSRAVTIGAEIS